MAFSIQRAVSDGTMTLLPISIEYFDREEISVLFDGVLNARQWAWVGTTDKTLSFTPAVANTVEVMIVRSTDLAELRHQFSLGAQFTAESLDESLLQILHIAQEAKEGSNLGGIFQNLNFHGFKAINMGNGSDPGDAVNHAQMEAHDAQIVVYRDQAAASAAAAAQSVVDAQLAPVAVPTHAAPFKSVPVDADEFPVVDSASTWTLKRVTWANIKGQVWSALGGLILAGTPKTAPVDADYLPLADSAAAGASKALAWSSVKATLKTYFDTLYQPKVAVVSMVRLAVAAGYGSTNTAIRRFSTVLVNSGPDITYTDSPTLGGSFTVNTSGCYSVSLVDCFAAASGWMGVSVNTTAPTTQINAIPVAEGLVLTNTTGANLAAACSWTGTLNAGAVVRVHGQAGLAAGSGANAIFTITRVS